MKEETGSVALQNITLPSGAFFERLEQVYSRYGEAEADGANVILVCHALTGSPGGAPSSATVRRWIRANTASSASITLQAPTAAPRRSLKIPLTADAGR